MRLARFRDVRMGVSQNHIVDERCRAVSGQLDLSDETEIVRRVVDFHRTCRKRMRWRIEFFFVDLAYDSRSSTYPRQNSEKNRRPFPDRWRYTHLTSRQRRASQS